MKNLILVLSMLAVGVNAHAQSQSQIEKGDFEPKPTDIKPPVSLKLQQADIVAVGKDYHPGWGGAGTDQYNPSDMIVRRSGLVEWKYGRALGRPSKKYQLPEKIVDVSSSRVKSNFLDEAYANDLWVELDDSESEGDTTCSGRLGSDDSGDATAVNYYIYVKSSIHGKDHVMADGTKVKKIVLPDFCLTKNRYQIPNLERFFNGILVYALSHPQTR